MSILTSFLDKSVSLSQMGKRWESALCADLAEAARTISYTETVGNKADTVHRYAKRSDHHTMKRAVEYPLRKVIKRLGLKQVELAIDGKKDLYYGNKGRHHARGIKSEHGADEAWEYIVISIVHPMRIPLMAIPYPMGADLTEICIELLEFAKKLPIHITKILFDRGFYIWHLIDYLESQRGREPLPYQILVPQNEATKEYVKTTKGELGVFTHKGKYSKEKSTWKTQTTIVVCKNAGKNKKGKSYDMIFATNLKPTWNLIRQYKRRWNIETGFRVMEEGKIKTKSNNPLIRFFYFLLRALFTLIWKVHKVFRCHATYKRFLKLVESHFRKGMVWKPPPIVPVC